MGKGRAEWVLQPELVFENLVQSEITGASKFRWGEQSGDMLCKKCFSCKQ